VHLGHVRSGDKVCALQARVEPSLVCLGEESSNMSTCQPTLGSGKERHRSRYG
jgi:hypothetical protein